MDKSKDENISNHGYINISILWIYRIYRRHIDEYFKKQYLWNQGLANLDFDDNKTRFITNDYILSVIRQDDFQNGNPKTNQAKEKSWRKRPPQREEFFKTKAS